MLCYVPEEQVQDNHMLFWILFEFHEFCSFMSSASSWLIIEPTGHLAIWNEQNTILDYYWFKKLEVKRGL